MLDAGLENLDSNAGCWTGKPGLQCWMLDWKTWTPMLDAGLDAGHCWTVCWTGCWTGGWTGLDSETLDFVLAVINISIGLAPAGASERLGAHPCICCNLGLGLVVLTFRAIEGGTN